MPLSLPQVGDLLRPILRDQEKKQVKEPEPEGVEQPTSTEQPGKEGQ